MAARLARLLVLALVFSLVGLATPAQAQKVKGDFFGMHDAQIASGSVPTVKLGSVRLWDTGTSWRQIETAPTVFDWSNVDSAVQTAKDAGLRPLLVLGQTPQFYAADPTAPSFYGDGASSMPDLAAWKRYVKAAADRYGNQVDYQVWNEPNVVGFWSGSVAQMAKLTATAGQIITKSAGRKSTVVAPSFPLRLGGQQKWFKKFWSAKVGGKSVASFVDVVSVNPYPDAKQGPEAALPLISFAKRALPKVAKRKPMWNTEINYGLAQGGSGESGQLSEAKQAAYVGRTLLVNAGASMRRTYWYLWAGVIGNTRLVESDRSTLTRGGKAWQEVRGWIIGTDMKGCKKVGKGRLAGLWTCTARGGRNDVRRFYWKPSGKAVSIRTPSSTTSWTDLSGDTTKRQGRYSLKVGFAPVMVSSRR